MLQRTFLVLLALSACGRHNSSAPQSQTPASADEVGSIGPSGGATTQAASSLPNPATSAAPPGPKLAATAAAEGSTDDTADRSATIATAAATPAPTVLPGPCQSNTYQGDGSFGFVPYSQTAQLGAPFERTVIQRRDSDKAGTIKIFGTLTDTEHPADLAVNSKYCIEAMLTLVDSTYRGTGQTWRQIDHQSLTPITGTANATFNGSIDAAAGGWYTLTLRLYKYGVLSTVGLTPTAKTLAIARVGIGEVFLIAGQSNASNNGEIPANNPKGFYGTQVDDRASAMNYNGGTWQHAGVYPLPAADNSIGGAPWPRMAHNLIQALKVPVGFINVAVGATYVEQWQAPDPKTPTAADDLTYAAPTTTLGTPTYTDGQRIVLFDPRQPFGFGHSLFDNLKNMTTYAHIWLGDTRGILWVQGETNATGITTPYGVISPSTVHSYQIYLHQLTASLRSLTGVVTPWFIAQNAYFPGDNPTYMDNVIQAQVNVASGAQEELYLGPPTFDLTLVNGDYNNGSPRNYNPLGMRDAYHRCLDPNLKDQSNNGPHLSTLGLDTHGIRWANLLLNGTQGFKLSY